MSMTRITAWTRRQFRRAWSTLGLRRHTASIVATAADLCRSRRDLLIENAVPSAAWAVATPSTFRQVPTFTVKWRSRMASGN